jgi:hypothetical protein
MVHATHLGGGVDGLFQVLDARRKTWSREHQGAEFPGVCSLAVAPELASVDLKSVVGTMAYAACPTLRAASFEIHAEHGLMAGLAGLQAAGSFLDVRVARDGNLLAWRNGSWGAQVVWEERTADVSQLTKLIALSWLQHGEHRQRADAERDQCLVHLDDDLRWGHLAPVLDAIDDVQRGIERAGRTVRMPVFLTTLAIR